MTTELKAEVETWSSGIHKPKPVRCEFQQELEDRITELKQERVDAWAEVDLNDISSVIAAPARVNTLTEKIRGHEEEIERNKPRLECYWQDDPDCPEGRADMKCTTCGSVQFYRKVSWTQLERAHDLEAMAKRIIDRRLAQ